MKKIFKISILLGILLIISNIAFATTTGLEEFLDLTVDSNVASDAPLLTDLPVDSESVSIINDTVTIDADIYTNGENVVLEENVNGSVHITATSVNITSNQIEGNLFVIADEININSYIKGSAFLIANTINFNGEVYDLYTISNNLNINSDSNCNSIKTISENLNIEGNVERNLYAISSNLNLVENSNVLINGNIYCLGEVFGDKTKAENIEFYTPNFEIKEETVNAIEKGLKTAFFVLTVSTGFLIIMAIVIFTSRKRIENVDISNNFFKYIGDGLVYYLLSILISILLMVTIIGIPFAILLLVLITLLMAKITLPLATIEIAKLMLKNKERKSKILVTLIAFFVFLCVQYLKLVPVIGNLLNLILSLYGFGIIVNALLKNKKNEPEIEIITNNS